MKFNFSSFTFLFFDILYTFLTISNWHETIELNCYSIEIMDLIWKIDIVL